MEVAQIKFGITKSPHLRFTGEPVETSHATRRNRCTMKPHIHEFVRMEVLYCCGGVCAGRREAEPILLYSGNAKCLNIRAGADGPISDFMYLYVLLNNLSETTELWTRMRKRIMAQWRNGTH